MKREIEQCMSDLQGAGGTASARFRFPADFVGFQGHFPDKKILPGVSQVQCVLTALEGLRKAPVELREVVLAKFFAPVGPEEEVRCSCSDIKESGEFVVKAVLERGGQKVSELKLRVRTA